MIDLKEAVVLGKEENLVDVKEDVETSVGMAGAVTDQEEGGLVDEYLSALWKRESRGFYS